MQIYIVDTQKVVNIVHICKKNVPINYFFANFSKVTHPLAFSHYRVRAL